MPDWDWRMQIYEPASFARKYLLPRLDVQPMEGPLALHVTCSSQRSGNAGDMEALARALAKKVRGRLGPGHGVYVRICFVVLCITTSGGVAH
jgi:hypothetical protein